MRKRLFYINSRNRVSGEDSDFLFKLHMQDINPQEAVVLSANIPKSYYLFQDGQNTFTLTEDGKDATITINVGSYSISSLRVKLQTLMNAGSPNGYAYTVSTSTTTSGPEDGKYVFGVSGNAAIQPTITFTTYCYEQMGFSKNTTHNFAADSLTSVAVIKLQKEDTILIHSDLATNDGKDSILQEIYATSSSSFSNIVFQQFAPEYYSKRLISNNNNLYHFYLTNEDGQPMDLNGQNWSMTICIYEPDNSLINFLKNTLLTLVG